MAEVFLRALSGMLTEAPSLLASADEDLRDLLGMVGRRFRELVIGPFLSESVIANYARMIVEFQSHSVAHLLDAAAAPTLLISAENDVIAHPGGSDAAARRMPNARSVRLAGASHWCLLENAEELIEEIDLFLSRVEAGQVM
jgi:pimeloyl-ACP methyl ester carboxylesterase